MKVKNKLFPILLILPVCLTTNTQAQDAGWRVLVEQLAEEEGANAENIDNLYEELLFLENNPINLNSVTHSQLEQFPLLSTEELNSLIAFLEKNRPIQTVYELRNTPRLDYRKVALILPFFYAGKVTAAESPQGIGDMLKTGKHELQTRFDKTLTSRAGYGEFSDSILARYPNRKYQGEDFYTSIRYSFRYRNKLQLGITAEKDAGEPFMRPGYKKGYDHYGAHLMIKDAGPIRTAIVGDYRLSFGQGLVLNNDFMGSKAWNTDNVSRRTQQPKRHFSTAENGYFRGAAVSVRIANTTVTAFYSNRLIDTNLNSEGEITSFKVDGSHRTPLEIDKRKNSREQVGGANINYRKHRLQVGVSGIYHTYNRMYNPTLKEYNRYYLRGTSNINAGIDYSYQLPGFIFAGETAIDKNISVASINMLQYRAFDNLSLSLLHRHYPISYNALYAQVFSEGGRVQNEKGLYIGIGAKPLSRLSLTAYLDIARFPWPKYSIDTPSKATDIYFLATYEPSKDKSFDLRYKYKRKEKNNTADNPESPQTIPYATNKLRLRFSNQSSERWSFRTTADMAYYTQEGASPESGYLISQAISYRGRKRLAGDAYIAWFDADTYNARLYSYERDLISTFHMPSFHGKGIRLSLSAKYKIASNLTLSLKLGYTNYLNRDTIGNGTEKIDGNSRADMFTYLIWKF